jgi:hypothetical protein
MRKLLRGLHRKPYTALGTVFAIHSLMYAVGFLFGSTGFDGEPIYGAVDNLIRAVTFGVLMLVSTLALMVGFWTVDKRIVKFGLDTQTVIWLFISFVYFFHGMWVRAIGVGIVWVLLSCLLKVLYLLRHDEHYN